jgi:glycerol-3-phosphate cytidylyltransferase
LKKKIGYTTGVFDLFHIGHLNILRRAKENCDYLIVGVSTDELVQSYKNKSPIIPYSERKAIVEAIRYVDEVVPQETMDKVEAHSHLKFNVMFHGDDWRDTPLYIETEKRLKEIGVQMIYLPYTKGTSSTLLADTLRKVL